MFAKQWDLRWQAISPTRPGNIAMTTEIVDDAIGDWREKSTATAESPELLSGQTEVDHKRLPLWLTRGKCAT